ncbi:hypothetical protein ACIHDR_03585 [Nocardia sp. NPDC052278]|uniref:hypothetical protein n=1 Tax=unclassified Nocardia TaxID=2637762 RepID=UPI00369AE68A
MRSKPYGSSIDGASFAFVIALLGLPGAGKSTIKRQLTTLDHRYFNVINTTTRAPRINSGRAEVAGVDYFFVTREQFENSVVSGAMLNTTEIGGQLYGTGCDQYSIARGHNKIAIIDFDVSGFIGLSRVSWARISPFFILPKNTEAWKRQFFERYSSRKQAEEIWQARLEFAKTELEWSRSRNDIQFVRNIDPIDSAKQIHKSFQRGPSIKQFNIEGLIADIREFSG